MVPYKLKVSKKSLISKVSTFRYFNTPEVYCTTVSNRLLFLWVSQKKSLTECCWSHDAHLHRLNHQLPAPPAMSKNIFGRFSVHEKVWPHSIQFWLGFFVGHFFGTPCRCLTPINYLPILVCSLTRRVYICAFSFLTFKVSGRYCSFISCSLIRRVCTCAPNCLERPFSSAGEKSLTQSSDT